MGKKANLSFFLFTFCGVFFAQESIPFKTQSEFYLYGNATIIGNNILSKEQTKPYNNFAMTNDDTDMVFVDIDNDETTFSSSSAQLNLPLNLTKIKYAVLYWSATYSYEKGHRKESNGQFLFQGKRVKSRDKIDKIRLKLPNEDYKNINGRVIFDGANTSEFNLNSPYVCMADVTKLLGNANTVNGKYTVANVVATQGFVSGGSAAGWLLYVVYEAPTKNPKYITTYNGFAHVSNESVKLNFKNFKSLEAGEVKTTLTFAALEGDSALNKDDCLIVNPKLKRAMLLSSDNRPRNNFFNSKITLNDTEFNKRTPNSENTLGFDIISMDIPESSQPIVDNNTTEIEMIFNTESDRFYLFFTAFQTEISKVFYEEKVEETQLITQFNNTSKKEFIAKTKTIKPKKIKKKKRKKTSPIKTVINVKTHHVNITPTQLIIPKKLTLFKPKEIKLEPSKEAVKPIFTTDIEEKAVKEDAKTLPVWLKEKQQKEILNDDNVYQPITQLAVKNVYKTPLALNRENYEILLTPEDYVYETQTFKRILNQDAIHVSNVKKGHYIVANVVSDLDRAIAYQNTLSQKGVISELFKDAATQKHYIYLYNSENFYDVFMLRKAFIKSSFLAHVWISNINISSKIIKKL